jgi:hypothetical protein
MAVSNALLIIGMFMPKFRLAALFGKGFTGFSATTGGTTTSVARSHELSS